jgi:hypothetical protein
VEQAEQLTAGLPDLVLTGNGSRFLEEFLERPYKQAIFIWIQVSQLPV